MNNKNYILKKLKKVKNLIFCIMIIENKLFSHVIFTNYRMWPSAIWQISLEFLLFCDLF